MNSKEKEMEPYQFLAIAVEIGGVMLEHGAEVYRVETAIRYILSAYGVEKNNMEVFAIPSNIVVSVIDENDNAITRSKQIEKGETDLDKIDKLNSLCRYICQKKCSYEESKKLLTEIMAGKKYPLYVEMICYIIVGFSFTIFFNGNVRDALVGAVIACIIRILLWILDKLKSSEFFESILCSAFAATVALFSVKMGLADQSDKVIIGSLMTLVPGVAFTNCMRDLIVGDYLSGLMRMADAVLTATGVAIGVCTVISFLPRLFN